MARTVTIERNTKETQISVQLDLDGGEVQVNTGIGFFDHMLTAFGFYAGIGLKLTAKGDLYVDGHHTVEDTGIVLGQAIREALGDRKGIRRFGSAYVPMDEALAFTALDFSNRPYLVFDAEMPQERIGEYDSCLTLEFMRAVAHECGYYPASEVLLRGQRPPHYRGTFQILRTGGQGCRQDRGNRRDLYQGGALMGYTAIVDYGVGNLMSVSNAMHYLGFETKITSNATELELADSILLPGVGAFPDAADKLRGPGLDQVLIAESKKKPILGICLGMQLLLERGEEVRPCKGLGFVKGSVRKIDTALKLPHIGWNELHFQNDSPLFRGIDEGAYVYFVHSFCAVAADESQVIARTDYGASVVAAVQSGNVFGTQFHPEKSGEIGLAMLKNFGEMNR